MIRPRRLAPGVELFPVRTPTLPPATHTNTYALVGGRDVLLVEPATPYPDERAEWLAWARGLATEGRRIVGVLATHHHIDHASAASEFARALSLGGMDVPLLAHEETFARLSQLYPGGLDGVVTRTLVDGQPLVLDDHRTWFALHTPGHAPGHICLHDRDGKTLIAGDMVANGSTILIPPDDGGDMAEYLVQLRRLDALATTLLLPAHGEPLDDPRAILRYYVEHRLKREGKVLAAVEAKKRELGREPSISEIVPLAYDDTPMHLWPIARAAAEAHWIKLRREGRV